MALVLDANFPLLLCVRISHAHLMNRYSHCVLHSSVWFGVLVVVIFRAQIKSEMMKKSKWTESIRNYEMRYHQYTNAACPFGRMGSRTVVRYEQPKPITTPFALFGGQVMRDQTQAGKRTRTNND